MHIIIYMLFLFTLQNIETILYNIIIILFFCDANMYIYIYKYILNISIIDKIN